MTGISYMAAIGRIMMAAIFLVSGFLHALHLSSPADVRAPIAVITTPDWAFYVATGIELFGGAFLALGLGTRYVALTPCDFHACDVHRLRFRPVRSLPEELGHCGRFNPGLGIRLGGPRDHTQPPQSGLAVGALMQRFDPA